MLDDQTPAPEAGDEDVGEAVEVTTDDTASETPDTGEQGQETDQPATDKESEETITRSKARRERRKVEMEQNREAAETAKREAQEANEKLSRMQDALQNAQPPQQGEHETYEEFQAKLSAFHSLRMFDERTIAETQANAAHHQQKAQSLTQQNQTEARSAFEDACGEARERYVDFDAIARNPNLSVSQDMAEIVLGLDTGPDVLYELGKNPSLAAQIAQMPTVQAALAIGRIEAGLAKPKPITTSNAPSPITPVRGRSGAPTKNADSMSMAEFVAARKSGKIK